MHQFNYQSFEQPKVSLWEQLADYTLAALIAASLTMAALAFFDVL